MQLNTNTDDITIVVNDTELENVSELCYLGHTMYNGNINSTDLKIAKATAKLHELGNVLRDHEIDLSIRRKLREACIRPRLAYATQSWRPKEQ